MLILVSKCSVSKCLFLVSKPFLLILSPSFAQIRVVNAFRSGLETGSLIHLSQLPQFPSTPNLRAARYNPTTVMGKETEV